MAKKDKKESISFTKKYKDVIIPGRKTIRSSDQLLTTGSPKLDLMLRGGFRMATISELYGPEGSGKSLIALTVARRVLDVGGKVLYLDLEKGLDGGVEYPDGTVQGWLQVNGIDPENPGFVIARPPTGEAVYSMVEEAIISGEFTLIVMDSMASLIPLAELEGEVGESAFGKVAKLNSDALKRVLHAYDKQEIDKTHFMIINQARDNMGSIGSHSTGGRALRHFVATKLLCTRTGKDAEAGVNILRIRTDKSRFSPPWEEVVLYIHPLHGIDTVMDILEHGVSEGYIEKAGSWYTLIDPKTGEEILKVQGKDAVRDFFNTNPDLKAAYLESIWETGRKTLLRKEQENDGN